MASTATTSNIDAVTTVASPDANVILKFEVLVDKISSLNLLSKELTGQVKALQKDIAKVVKETANANKKKGKGKKSKEDGGSSPPRAPSGFAKPTALSETLCSFLGVDAGTQMARTDVTRRINDYIKVHNLQDPSDKRNIIPDAKLSTLIQKENEDTPLTYFNLQSSIKHHFIKNAPSPA